MTLQTQQQQYTLRLEAIKDLEQDTDQNLKLLQAIDYIDLDFCAACCHYLSAKTNYEQRFAFKNINTILSEGYKKLYGFTTKEDSFWKKQIKYAVEQYQEFREEYLRITESLEGLQTKDVFNKEMRDLSVHYDANPIKVYQMLTNISGEEVMRRYIEFAFITSVSWQLNASAERSRSASAGASTPTRVGGIARAAPPVWTIQ